MLASLTKRSPLALLGALAFAPSPASGAQLGPGTVLSQQKISASAGGFGGALNPLDEFGAALVHLGDLDGDGVGDLAVGAQNSFFSEGAVWILFLNANGTVKAEQLITEGMGGFRGPLQVDRFGSALAALGDLDGDGTPDLAVGAFTDNTSVAGSGSVWILFLNANGTVKAEQKISPVDGGFTGLLQANDRFGASLASLGDLDGNGAADLAVGAVEDDAGAPNAGAVWILFLETVGTVASHQKISASDGGFAGVLNADDRFGAAVSPLDDLNGDGTPDLAVGARLDDDGGPDRGAVWLLFLDVDTGGGTPAVTVESHVKISASAAQFGAQLGDSEQFGHALALLGDLDLDGVRELAVGSPDGSGGSVWVLFLEPTGSVRCQTKIGLNLGGFAGAIQSGDSFGIALDALDDLDGDGIAELAIGASGDDDGGNTQGAVWIAFADGTTALPYGLTSDVGALSLSAGGTQNLGLHPGACHASDQFLLLGTMSGAVKGFPVSPFLIPLNLDAFFLATLAAAPLNTFLDSTGNGSASVVVPPGSDPLLAGTTVHRAFLVFDSNAAFPALSFVSNAVPLDLIP